MRSAYYSDLCSKFMIENTILKMEYAEVRVFSISDKVGSELLKKKFLFAYHEVIFDPPAIKGRSEKSCFSNRIWPPYATWTSCYWLPISICPLISCSGCLLSSPCCSAWRWDTQIHVSVLQGGRFFTSLCAPQLVDYRSKILTASFSATWLKWLLHAFRSWRLITTP